MSVTSNLPEFQKALTLFGKGTEKELKRFIVRISKDLQDRVIAKTPVGDTGFARASWNISVNTPDESVPVAATVKKHTEAGSIISEHRGKRGRGQLETLNPYSDTVWINNSIDYILELERGASHQAPAGMLLVSLAEIEAEIDGGLY